MPAQQRVCQKCEGEFDLMPNKPGLSIHCPACSEETTELLMAKVSWDGKHTQGAVPQWDWTIGDIWEPTAEG